MVLHANLMKIIISLRLKLKFLDYSNIQDQPHLLSIQNGDTQIHCQIGDNSVPEGIVQIIMIKQI